MRSQSLRDPAKLGQRQRAGEKRSRLEMPSGAGRSGAITRSAFPLVLALTARASGPSMSFDSKQLGEGRMADAEQMQAIRFGVALIANLSKMRHEGRLR
jgi:hypothetical protein